MIRSDEQWLSIADKFYDAAVERTGWASALEALADATGSRSGQLISVGTDATVPINLTTNIDPEALQAFVACGGGDPSANPRVKAGMSSSPLHSLTEEDFLAPHEHASHPHYRDFAIPWDIPFICLTNLERRPECVVGLSVLRSAREGHITSEQRAVFDSLAPHARAAIRMQMTLGERSAGMVRGTLESLGLAAFVCSTTGAVQAMTEQAEELVSSDRGLALRGQRLRAVQDHEDKVLTDAIAKSVRALRLSGATTSTVVVVRGASESSAPIVLDVIPLASKAQQLFHGPGVLVVARAPRNNDSQKPTLLQYLFGLTAAESEIAVQLAAGKSTEAIAQQRSVAVGTVRAQIKSALAKLGVTRQIELVAKLNEF